MKGMKYPCFRKWYYKYRDGEESPSETQGHVPMMVERDRDLMIFDSRVNTIYSLMIEVIHLNI